MDGTPTARGLAVLVAVLGVVTTACGSSDHSRPQSPDVSVTRAVPGRDGPTPHRTVPIDRGVPFARAKAVYARYGQAIPRRYPGVRATEVGVVVLGTRLPKPEDSVYGITVMVDGATHLPDSPQSIAGVPLRFRVRGHVVVH